MNALKEAMERAGIDVEYVLTSHAEDRVRQRAGIEDKVTATAWANEQIAKASRRFNRGSVTHHISELFEVITDGAKVVTVKPIQNIPEQISVIKRVVTRETKKRLSTKERDLRRVEITIAEHNLNQLKARNPKTKEIIKGRLFSAIDDKQRIKDEIYAIKKAAEQYGVIL